MDLYVFDKRLRLLFLDAIERIEVALRVAAAHRLGADDPWAHRTIQCLNPRMANTLQRNGRSRYENGLLKLDSMTKESREDFVAHFKRNYSCAAADLDDNRTLGLRHARNLF